MGLVLDTNILLRSVQPTHPMHAVAAAALTKLTTNGEDMYILPQNVREFWNVATRPENRNGLGFTHAEVEIEVQRIEALFPVLEDGPLVYQEWRRLVFVHKVSGVQVHDAYIAAGMHVYGIGTILTFNVGDFARYGLNAIDPTKI